jgi:hypothetical protein
MADPAGPARLSLDDWDRLRDAAEQLEAAWERGGDADLAAFLPPPGDRLRLPVLEELIKTELELRWSRGRSATLDDYLARFPELGGAAGVSPQLVYEEYRARQRLGDRPPLAGYRDRFPAQFPQLERLVAADPVPTPTGSSGTVPAGPSLVPLALKTGAVLDVGGGLRLGRRIGRGNVGEVWETELPGGFPAAVKVVYRPLAGQEARRELRALEIVKRLNHPFILRTHAYWILNDRLVILMDRAEGSLRDRMKECRQAGRAGIGPAELLTHFRDAADALDYLHGERVLHRDVKPDNLLLSGRRVRLADLGLAREQRLDSGSYSGCGTPAYMAPEAWHAHVCPQSDQYSLAYTYAELRMGRRPFPATDSANALIAHLKELPDLSPLGEAERRVLLKALAKTPEGRFASCAEMARALADALAGGAVELAVDDVPPAAGPPRVAAPPAAAALKKAEPPPRSGERKAVTVSGATWRAAPPAPGRRRWPAVVGCVLALLLLQGVLLYLASRPSGAVALRPAGPLTLAPGEAKDVPVSIDRRGYEGDVALSGTRGDGLSVEGMTIPPGRSEGVVRVTADAGAAAGRRQVRLRATAGGQASEVAVDVTVAAPGAPGAR